MNCWFAIDQFTIGSPQIASSQAANLDFITAR
jgi:hypothetical protein